MQSLFKEFNLDLLKKLFVLFVPGRAETTISAFFKCLFISIFFELELKDIILQLNGFIYCLKALFILPFPNKTTYFLSKIENEFLNGSPIHFLLFFKLFVSVIPL